MIGRKQPIIALYFESENVLKFYNLEVRQEDNVYRPLSDCHTLPDSTNGCVTDSNIICPFVSVGMRFLSVPHAVNAFRVR